MLQFHGVKTKKYLQIWWQQRWPRFRNKKTCALGPRRGYDWKSRKSRQLAVWAIVTMEEENPAVSRWWVSNIFYFHPRKLGKSSTHFDERAYFSDGLVKNPPNQLFKKVGHFLNRNFGYLHVFPLGCVFRVFRFFKGEKCLTVSNVDNFGSNIGWGRRPSVG